MSTSYEPALPQMMEDFNSIDDNLASLSISVYVLGYCLGPLGIAPFSEIHGRLPMLRGAYIVFLVTLVLCGFSNHIEELICLRVVMGFAGVVFVLLGPAMVSDIIAEERRGLALSIMTMGLAIVSIQFKLSCYCTLRLWTLITQYRRGPQ